MFYLKHFLKLSFARFPGRGSFFLILTLLLSITWGGRRVIKSYLFALLPQESFDPYFYALIKKSEDVSTIVDKIGQLPGVQSSEIIETQQLEDELRNVLNVLTLEDSFEYIGVKITFANIRESGQNLIRKHLIKLSGEENIFAGDIKRDSVFIAKRGFLVKMLQEWGEIFYFAILALFWLICFFLLSSACQNYAYLMEQFSTRKMILFKIMLSGSLLYLGLGMIGAYFLGMEGYYLIVAFILLANLFNFKKLRW